MCKLLNWECRVHYCYFQSWPLLSVQQIQDVNDAIVLIHNGDNPQAATWRCSHSRSRVMLSKSDSLSCMGGNQSSPVGTASNTESRRISFGSRRSFRHRSYSLNLISPVVKLAGAILIVVLPAILLPNMIWEADPLCYKTATGSLGECTTRRVKHLAPAPSRSCPGIDCGTVGVESGRVGSVLYCGGGLGEAGKALRTKGIV